jgi:hypothetical protein
LAWLSHSKNTNNKYELERYRQIMEWLEIIEVRAMGSNREILKSQLRDLINDLKKETELRSVKIYRQVMLETDFSIHLFHDSGKIESGCSSICSQLISSLKDFGFVNHTVWMETLNKGD